MASSQDMRVTVEVRIDSIGGPYGGGNLQIREDFQLPVSGFTELASILGRFHELAEKVKGEHV